MHFWHGTCWKRCASEDVGRAGILQPDVEWAADELPEAEPHYTRVELATTGSLGLSLEGWKRYELSNHLGNVLSVVNDRKSYVDDDEDGVADYYEPAILSATDYYPFGMAMAGRTFSTPDYRYGFNGKEKDTDMNGDLTHYDYGFRIYNAGIGKFLSVDPLTKGYPSWSPYPFAMNRPIDGIDLDGLEYFPKTLNTETGEREVRIKLKLVFQDYDNTSSTDKRSVANEIEEIVASNMSGPLTDGGYLYVKPEISVVRASDVDFNSDYHIEMVSDDHSQLTDASGKAFPARA